MWRAKIFTTAVMRLSRMLRRNIVVAWQKVRATEHVEAVVVHVTALAATGPDGRPSASAVSALAPTPSFDFPVGSESEAVTVPAVAGSCYG